MKSVPFTLRNGEVYGLRYVTCAHSPDHPFTLPVSAIIFLRARHLDAHLPEQTNGVMARNPRRASLRFAHLALV